MRSERLAVNKLKWQARIALKQADTALRLIREYLDKHNDCFDAWYFMAVIKARGGEPEAARKFLLKALELGFSELELLERDADMKKVFEEIKAAKNGV